MKEGKGPPVSGGTRKDKSRETGESWRPFQEVSHRVRKVYGV